MKIGITYKFKQNYLPNKRCKNPRYRIMVTTEDVDIKEIEQKDFPVAFKVHDYCSRNGKYGKITDEIRTFDGKLYTIWRIESGENTGDVKTVTDIYYHLKHILPYEYEPWRYTEKDMYKEGQSIILTDNKDVYVSMLNERAEDFLIDETGAVWVTCGEPVYHILTFGLGHNHGGTGFFIDYHYNPNCSAENYFNALQYKEACEYFDNVATGRGDTNSVGRYENKYIEVLMPEIVKRNPAVEHADGGDPFMDALEGIANNSKSVAESGLLTMAYAMASIAQQK